MVVSKWRGAARKSVAPMTVRPNGRVSKAIEEQQACMEKPEPLRASRVRAADGIDGRCTRENFIIRPGHGGDMAVLWLPDEAESALAKALRSR